MWFEIYLSKWSHRHKFCSANGDFGDFVQVNCHTCPFSCHTHISSTIHHTMSPSTAKSRADPVSWSSTEEAVLIDTLLEQQDRMQSETGWKPVVWSIVAQALSELRSGTSKKKQADHCKSRWRRVSRPIQIPSTYIAAHLNNWSHFIFQFKEEYKIVKVLREQSGFGWDEATQLVTAPEDVWEAYLAVSLNFFVVDPVSTFALTLRWP